MVPRWPGRGYLLCEHFGKQPHFREISASWASGYLLSKRNRVECSGSWWWFELEMCLLWK